MREYADLLGLSVMNEFSIDPRTTSLVVVDMQYGSCHAEYGHLRLYRDLGIADAVRYYQERVNEMVMPNIQRLLRAFRRTECEIIFLTVGDVSSERENAGPRERARTEYLRQRGMQTPRAVPGTKDNAVLPELAPQPGEAVIHKTTASAFNSSSFASYLQDHGLTTLVVCGVGTNYCVEMTFRDASDRGYLCVLAEDACGAYTPELHERAVDVMRHYGRVESTDTILRELASGNG